MRGASAPTQVTAGYVSLLALWMGGACAPRSTPPTPPSPQPTTDEGPRRKDGRRSPEELRQDEIEVLNLANIVIMLLCQDD